MEQKDVLQAMRRDHAAELKMAAERLEGTAKHTQIIASPVLSEMTGHTILLKPENLQVTGSFKIRGAYNKIASLTDEELEKRRILGTEGFVSCFAVVDTDAAEVVSGPKVYLNAVAEDESEFEKVRHQIVEQLRDAMMTGTKDTHKLQQIMRRTLGGWVSRELKRKPMIVPVVADVAADMNKMESYND